MCLCLQQIIMSPDSLCFIDKFTSGSIVMFPNIDWFIDYVIMQHIKVAIFLDVHWFIEHVMMECTIIIMKFPYTYHIYICYIVIQFEYMKLIIVFPNVHWFIIIPPPNKVGSGWVGVGETMGRSLFIFSNVTFKMAAWQPYWIFRFPDFSVF